jgi:hypothetical protein
MLAMPAGSTRAGSTRGEVMNREAIEVGVYTWDRLQRHYDADAAVHWQRYEAKGWGLAW